MESPKYLPLTPGQEKKLESLIKLGYTVIRVQQNGVETLRVTKPRNKRR